MEPHQEDVCSHTPIETMEYSWESNFDRFETILYRKAWVENKPHSNDSRHQDKEPGGRKQFCRDYNRPKGCPRNSPHVVWVGSGQSAAKRTVYHFCAACLIRDKQQREHPEGHPDCPHKDWPAVEQGTRQGGDSAIEKESDRNTPNKQENSKQPDMLESSQRHPWEAQVGWVYHGHGEWIQLEPEGNGDDRGNPLLQEPEWIQQWLGENDEDIAMHEAVVKGGYPNRWGARLPVNSRWNLQRFEELLGSYEDIEVVEWLSYGWPTGRLPTLPQPTWNYKNHKGAVEFPEQLQKYITKESKYGAIMGPFQKIPFHDNIGISPLSKRPKKGTMDHRIILDLSFPIGEAVSDGISKDTYLGFEAKLTFPKTDDFAFRIFQLGKGCYMFKIDLSRYFRQIPLDPADYSLIGYVVNGEI